MCFQSWLWGMSESLLKRQRPTPRAKAKRLNEEDLSQKGMARLIKLRTTEVFDPKSKCAC